MLGLLIAVTKQYESVLTNKYLQQDLGASDPDRPLSNQRITDCLTIQHPQPPGATFRVG